MNTCNKIIPCVNITGVVLAISHTFILNFDTFFIKILATKLWDIIVRKSEHLKWIASLKIGIAYRFTRLIPSYMNKGECDEIQLLETSSKSEICAIQFALQDTVMNACLTSVSYSGIITNDSLSDLGVFELEGGAILCSSFIDRIARIPPIKKFDSVIVYNAHCRIIDEVKYIIMCGKSYMLSETRSCSEPHEAKHFHPIIDFIIAKKLNFEDFLRIKYLYFKLDKLLKPIFNQESSIIMRNLFEIINGIFYNGQWNAWNQIIGSASFYQITMEFMISPHACLPMSDSVLPDIKILTVEDCYRIDTKDIIPDKTWNYQLFSKSGCDKFTGNNFALVGKLEVDAKTGHFSLNSGSVRIQCVIPNQIVFKENIRTLVNKLVSIKKFIKVTENFLFTNDNEKNTEKTFTIPYILVHPKDIYPLINLESTQKTNSEQIRNLDCIKMNSDELSRENDISESFVQWFILDHVSAAMTQKSGKLFLCLGNLLERSINMESVCMLNTEKTVQHRKFCLICLKGKMLETYPLLCENRIYALKYPKCHGENLFDKSSFIFPEMDMAKKFLPIVNGVVIPINSTLEGPYYSSLLPVDAVIEKEVYRIKDSVNDVAENDVVHLKGVVLGRRHQSSKYHQPSFMGGGYGIPGRKNIILELRDEMSGETVTVYIIKWMHKQYPLCLLPGAVVCIKFVEKKSSSKNNYFYQTTCMTSISILEFPEEAIDSIALWEITRHSFLAIEKSSNLLTPFWGIFSISKIWSLELTAHCNMCNTLMINGRCSYVGCSSLLKKPVINAKANVAVEDGSENAFMHVKNDHVRILLRLSEKEWECLGDVVKEKELSYKLDISMRDEQNEPRCKVNVENMDQLAFKIFCENAVTINSWHVLCKKFCKQEGKAIQLFCLDLQEFCLERAASLCEFLSQNFDA